MQKMTNESSKYDRALKQAHLWREKLFDDEVDECVVEAFERWHEADPIHRKAYQEVLSLNESLSAIYRSLDAIPLKDPKDRSNSILWVRKLCMRFFAPKRKRVAFAFMMAFTMLTIGFLVTFEIVERPKPIEVFAEQRFSTGTGHIDTIVLGDGTRITLSGDSAVIAKYSDQRRIVELERGAAFFDVAKNSTPFFVKASHLDVMVTGTAFEVSMHGAMTRTTVEHGNVKLSYPLFVDQKPSGILTSVELSQGQQAVATTNRGVKLDKDVSSDDIAAWRHGFFDFRGATLSEIVSELNRFSDIAIAISNDVPAEKLKVRGRFSIDDIDAVLNTIAIIHGVVIDKTQEQIITIRLAFR